MASSRLLFVWICSVFLLKSLPMSDLPMLPDDPILVVRVFFDPNDIVRRRPTCKANLRYNFQHRFWGWKYNLRLSHIFYQKSWKNEVVTYRKLKKLEKPGEFIKIYFPALLWIFLDNIPVLAPHFKGSYYKVTMTMQGWIRFYETVFTNLIYQIWIIWDQFHKITASCINITNRWRSRSVLWGSNQHFSFQVLKQTQNSIGS